MIPVDFKVLLPAVRAGDKAARDKLMESFYAWSVSQVKRIVREPELAKNIALDFWDWFFTKGGVLAYDPQKGAFYPWMEARLSFRAYDALKKQQPTLIYNSEVNDPTSFDPDPIFRIQALQDLDRIANALHSADQKEVFWRLLEGATAAEIAEECDVSIKRARNLIGQVRATIRAVTGDE